MHKIVFAAFAAAGLLANGAARAEPPPPGYHITAHLAGPDGGWDYASYDASRNRVLVARSAAVDAFDLGAGGAGLAIAPATRGHAALAVNGGSEILVTNGDTATAVFLNAATGAPIVTVPTGQGPDAVAVDAASGKILVMDHRGGEIDFIDARSHRSLGRLTVGGALEAAALDGQGHAFVNVEDRNEIAVVDIASQTVTGRYPLPGCEGPTGIAYATGEDLLIVACDGVADLVRASTGATVRTIEIGDGADGVAWDPTRKRAMIPAGESATLAVLQIAGGDATLLETIPTRSGGRTIALDPITGDAFIPTATYAPAVEGHRSVMNPGSFELLVIAPGS
jgi:DNA-binding beta-propeller fold protein YncE